MYNVVTENVSPAQNAQYDRDLCCLHVRLSFLLRIVIQTKMIFMCCVTELHMIAPLPRTVPKYCVFHHSYISIDINFCFLLLQTKWFYISFGLSP